MYRTLAVAIPAESKGSHQVDMSASGATQAGDRISPETVGDNEGEHHDHDEDDEEDTDAEEFFYDSREVLFEPFRPAPRDNTDANGGDDGGNDGPLMETRDRSADDGESEPLCYGVLMEVVGSVQACAAQREAEKQQEEEIVYLRRKCITLQKALMDTENKLASTIKEMEDRIQMEIDSSSRRNRKHIILSLCIGVCSLAVLYNWRRIHN